MSRSTQYRALAEDCDREAAVARDLEVKIQFQKLARRWREMEIQAAVERPNAWPDQ